MQQPSDGHHSPAKLPGDVVMPEINTPWAVLVAIKVVKHAFKCKNIHEDKMCCPDCKLILSRPVTGRCGHTRCTICIKRNGACSCGVPQPEKLCRNILIQDIIEKMMSHPSLIRVGGTSSANVLTSNQSEQSLIPSTSSGKIRKPARIRKLIRQSKERFTHPWQYNSAVRRMTASPEMRFDFARDLMASGRFSDAAAHLAYVAASSTPSAIIAKVLLAQVITMLSAEQDPRRLLRPLFQSVRQLGITSWVDSSAVECPICYNVLEHPVTTVCGHTFCRCCINRTMQNRNMCPLCSTSLSDTYLAQTKDTEFVSAILGTITETPQFNPDFIPIFACTVAFPEIPCPLMIFDSDFRNVIHEILDSGSRRFGMLASLGDNTYDNYGTIVEVRDCVVFEDGRSILSTVGRTRFLVIEKVAINGCFYARIQKHTDIRPVGEMTIFNLQLLAQRISYKVQKWLPSLNTALGTDIASCFGTFPEMNLEGEWWDNPNGPIWLWWLITILPLKSEIKMLMLSTKHLNKRMTAVLRTLDAMAIILTPTPKNDVVGTENYNSINRHV